MASSYTSNYNLCQWEPEDKVLRTDFNADNAKIDAAIAAVDSRITGVAGSKASAASLAELKSTVEDLSATVSGQGGALRKRGNCQVAATSYTGDGQKTRTHSLGVKPALVFISGGAQMTIGYGCTLTYNHENSVSAVGVEWSGNSFTLRSLSTSISDDARAIGNRSGVVYQMIILYDMSL